MFTGIIEELGEVLAVAPSGEGLRITIRGPLAASDARHGDSIAVSGVCLTVVEQGEDWFAADVMAQSVAVTAIGELAPGGAVNLERAARLGDRLGGHLVQGHVDAVGAVLAVRPGEQWQVVRIALPESIAALVADKGSITVDGVSLTVSGLGGEPGGEWFEISLIPETLTATTLGRRAVGDRVNLESDVLARHVQRLLARGGQEEATA